LYIIILQNTKKNFTRETINIYLYIDTRAYNLYIYNKDIIHAFLNYLRYGRLKQLSSMEL